MSADRLALTLGTLAFAGGFWLLMLKGWRSRQRRQGDLPPPALPPHPRAPLLVGAVPGTFIGTVFAGDWLDRVVVHGLSDRSAAWLVLAEDGVHIEREGGAELYLPYRDVQAAAPGDALAGKVIGPQGLLLLTWTLGSRTLQTAFRANDHATHARVAAVIGDHLPARETAL